MSKDVQIAVRLESSLLERLDELVPDPFPTRAEAVRFAVSELLRSKRERRLEERYIRGYEEIPDDDLEAWAAMSGREMIAEEPW